MLNFSLLIIRCESTKKVISSTCHFHVNPDSQSLVKYYYNDKNIVHNEIKVLKLIQKLVKNDIKRRLNPTTIVNQRVK